MKLLARLPLDREAEGEFQVLADTGVLLGPVRCRGEADNAGALTHGNVQEDPTKSHGDHPYGVYRCRTLVRDPHPARSYGPFFLSLAPVGGEALVAWQNGRRGLGIHGGDLGAGSTLRATYGCLRLDNETMETLARLVAPRLDAGEDLVYECRPWTP